MHNHISTTDKGLTGSQYAMTSPPECQIELSELQAISVKPTFEEGANLSNIYNEQDLLLVARQQLKKRRRWNRRAIFLLLMSCPQLVLSIMWSRLVGAGGSYNVIFAMLGMGMAILAVYCLRRGNRSIGFNAEELARHEGVRAIPTLLGSLGIDGTEEARRGIYKVLAIVLPQLKASDAGLLTSYHRSQLNNLLFMEWHPTFRYTPNLDCTLAVLKALEQVGDSRAIPHVERLANRPPLSARQRKIQRAALECLPMLTVNASAVEARLTLLRCSSANEIGTDSLLRPVTSDSQPTPRESDRELLRATEVAESMPDL